MTVSADDKPARQQLMDDAALWLARLDSGSADPAEFEAWRAEDPHRAAAFAQIAGAARALDRVKPELKQRTEREKPVDRRQFVFAGAAAATLAIGGGLAAFFVGQSKATASTRVGGRQSISLALGGRLELNTDSKVQWKAQDKRLQVWLRRGEIALDIRAPIQQCILYGGHTVAALGVGKVNARLRGDLLDLTVVSGECTVASTGATAPVGPMPSRRPVIVKANEAVLAGGGQQVVRSVDEADLQFISAWPSDELVFQGQTLETAVGEYNRYLDHKIIIADPALASIRLGGRFTTHNPSAFLAALHSGFGVKVTQDDTGTTVLTK